MTWPLSPLETAWCVLALTTGYAVRGVAGFGSGAVATPLLSFVLPLTTTAPLITILGFTVSLRLAMRDWRQIDWKAFVGFVPGILIGVPLGLWVFKAADPALLVRLLGAYVLAYAIYSLLGERGYVPHVRATRWMLVGTSTLGAVVATLFGGMSGPIYVTYFDALRMTKGVFRVTVSTTLLALASVRLIGYFGSGVFALNQLVLVLGSAVPVLAGTWAGEWLHGRIDARTFRRIVAGLLLVSGAALVVR